MEERFLYLIKQKLNGQATGDEMLELEQLLRESEELQQFHAILLEKNNTAKEDRLLAEQAYATQCVQLQLKRQFEDDESASVQPVPGLLKRIFSAPAFAIAASLLIAIICVYFFQSRGAKSHDTNQNEIVTKKGSKSKITLPDGTQVWLNADSKISYSDNFKTDLREVQLTGEAFFDVTRDSKRPFIIHTSTMDVRVLGTVFNIRSYPDENTSETSLLHGMVEIALKSQPDKKITLRPNEKLIVSNNTSDVPPQNVTVEDKQEKVHHPVMILDKVHYANNDSMSVETSWINNVLVFDHEPVEKVFYKIECWYNVEIIDEKNELRLKHFTGTFQNKPLSEVMESLRTAFEFRYEMKGDKIIIKY